MMPEAVLVNPAMVRLGLAAANRDEAVRLTAELLRGDERVGAWDDFWRSIGPKQVVDLSGGVCGVCLAHGRSGSVKKLTVAAGRLAEAVTDAKGEPVRLVFVFGIPAAMSEEYLRTVGALARLCKDPSRLGALLETPTAEDFARQLEEWIG